MLPEMHMARFLPARLSGLMMGLAVEIATTCWLMRG